MPRYLAICSYDGTHYKGFQKQIDGGTIQDNIEEVLSKLLNVKTDLQRVTKANISVKVTDEFMNAVKNKEK